MNHKIVVIRVRSRRSTPGNSRPVSANSWNSLGSSRNIMDDDLVMAIGNRGRGKGEFTNPQVNIPGVPEKRFPSLYLTI